MATHTAATAQHATLTAATMDTVTLTNPSERVIIKSRSTTPGTAIFATVNGPDPTVGGDDTIVIPAGETYVTPESQAIAETIDVVVKLISATADAYTVMAEG